MSRSLLATLVLVGGLTAGATGCTTCASPDDYCGPVYTGGCEPCIVNQRVGSAFDDPGVGPYPNTSPMPQGRTGPAGAGGTRVDLNDDEPPPLEIEPRRSDSELTPPSARSPLNLRR